MKTYLLICYFLKAFSDEGWEVCQVTTVNPHTDGSVATVMQGQGCGTEIRNATSKII